jgi:hypothetical protein
MLLSPEILSESKSARNSLINNNERAFESLNKAKALVMGVWQGTGFATTEQVAQYYEIEPEVLRQIIVRNKEEFNNEVKNITGTELQDARNLLSLPSRTSQALVWSPRAMLRVGLMLTQSPVAKNVRDVVLNVVEAAPQNQLCFY